VSKNINETVIPIYSVNGDFVNQLVIKDKLNYISGRVSKGKEYFYKGVGMPYSHHYKKDISDLNSNEYNFLGHTNIFYLGYGVENKSWQNKFGIFQDKYQPFFTDFIGGCGIKEKAITPNSVAFKKSSVDILDVILYDKENQQFYFKMNYKCNRKNYITDNGNPKKLYELIEYMIDNDWNFLWDKNSINDITPEGLVSDIADLFISEELEHQFGSVYSVLFSLYKSSQKKYEEFINHIGLKHLNDKSFVVNTTKILDDNGIDTQPLFPHDNDNANYIHTVMYYLLRGKNCAYCSCDMFIAEGELVKQHYWNKFMQEVQSRG
tara:strand:+ start:3055 stop:4017 length:963 start_codon:yes stop_codon:yes gene_type:complete